MPSLKSAHGYLSLQEREPTKPGGEERMLWGYPQIRTRNSTQKKRKSKTKKEEKKNSQAPCSSQACAGVETTQFLNNLCKFPKMRV